MRMADEILMPLPELARAAYPEHNNPDWLIEQLVKGQVDPSDRTRWICLEVVDGKSSLAAIERYNERRAAAMKRHHANQRAARKAAKRAS